MQIRGVYCNTRTSFMLSAFRRKIRRIFSAEKVVVRRFSNMNSEGDAAGQLGCCSSYSSKLPIRIATFNVAMFLLAPATHEEEDYAALESPEKMKLSEVVCMAEVLREVDADILALQDVKAEEENSMKPLSDLAAALGMYYVFAESWAPEYGNAFLSKWPIQKSKVQKIADDEDFRNVLKATIDVPWAGQVNLYCTQLDYLIENWRMKQISAMIQSNDIPHILAGSLNSLTSSDYSSERWMDMIKYFEQIGKPAPKTEVMRHLRRTKYVDAKDNAEQCEPPPDIIAEGHSVQGTCKQGTRVDYILASPDSPYKFVPGSYSVISSKGTSDHHIVKVDVRKVSEIAEKGVIGRPRKNLNKRL